MGTFAFVASHILSAAVRHASEVAELLRLINKLEELHTKVQEMIKSPHLATTLLFNMLRWWSLYLNKCVTASSSEDVGAPGAMVLFSLELILIEIEGGRYVGPLLPVPLVHLVSGIRGGGVSRLRDISRGGNRGGGKVDGRGCGGGGVGSGGGSRVGGGRGRGAGWGGVSDRCGGSVSTMRAQERYGVHLPALYLRERGKSRNILAGTFLPTVQGHVLCKNWHLCRLCWEDCEH